MSRKLRRILGVEEHTETKKAIRTVLIITGKTRSNTFCKDATEDKWNQPSDQRPKRWISLDGGDSQIHEYGSGTKALDTPPDPEDRSSDEQLPVNHTTFGYAPCSAQSWVFLSSPIEVGNGGNWQCSQSEEDEGGVEVTVKWHDEELDNPAGHGEGSQVESEPELHGRQK